MRVLTFISVITCLLVSRLIFISLSWYQDKNIIINGSNNFNYNYFYNIIVFGNGVVNNDGIVIFLQDEFKGNESIDTVIRLKEMGMIYIMAFIFPNVVR